MHPMNKNIPLGHGRSTRFGSLVRRVLEVAGFSPPSPGAKVRWDPREPGSPYIYGVSDLPPLRLSSQGKPGLADYGLVPAMTEDPLRGLGADCETGFHGFVGVIDHQYGGPIEPSTRREDPLHSLLIEARAVAMDGYEPDRSERDAVAELCDRAEAMLAALKAMVLNDRHTYRDCHKRAVALIAQAEGKAAETGGA